MEHDDAWRLCMATHDGGSVQEASKEKEGGVVFSSSPRMQRSGRRGEVQMETAATALVSGKKTHIRQLGSSLVSVFWGE